MALRHVESDSAVQAPCKVSSFPGTKASTARALSDTAASAPPSGGHSGQLLGETNGGLSAADKLLSEVAAAKRKALATTTRHARKFKGAKKASLLNLASFFDDMLQDVVSSMDKAETDFKNTPTRLATLRLEELVDMTHNVDELVQQTANDYSKYPPPVFFCYEGFGSDEFEDHDDEDKDEEQREYDGDFIPSVSMRWDQPPLRARISSDTAAVGESRFFLHNHGALDEFVRCLEKALTT